MAQRYNPFGYDDGYTNGSGYADPYNYGAPSNYGAPYGYGTYYNRIPTNDAYVAPTYDYLNQVGFKKRQREALYLKWKREQEAKQKAAQEKEEMQINSFMDVIFNTSAKEKRYGEINNPLDWITHTVHSGYDYFKDSYVEPLFEGDFERVAVNAIGALGEDLDILANAVKGMINEAESFNESLGIGAIGGVIGGIAALASGPVGWATLGAIGAGAGLGAAAGALIKDSDKAALGFQRAFGLTGEGRFNYRIETGNMLTDIGAEIVLDPFNWFTFGGAAIANSRKFASTSTKALLRNADDVGRVSLKELYKASDTFIEKLYLGTQAMRKADDIWTKVAWKGNPLSYPLSTAKFGFNKITGNELTMKYLYDVARKKFGSSEELLSDYVLDYQNVTGKVEAWKQLDNDMHGVNKVLRNSFEENGVDLFKEFPVDRAPLKNYAMDRISYYKNLAGDFNIEDVVMKTREDIIALLTKKGSEVGDELAQEAMHSLRFFNPPADAAGTVKIGEIADALVADSYGAMILAEELALHTKATQRLILDNIPDGASKLEVLDHIEKQVVDGLGANGATLNEALALMSGYSDDVATFYKPTMDMLQDVMTKYGIDSDAVVGFLKRDPAVMESLAQESAVYQGVKVLDPEKLSIDRLVPDGMQEGFERVGRLADEFGSDRPPIGTSVVYDELSERFNMIDVNDAIFENTLKNYVTDKTFIDIGKLQYDFNNLSDFFARNQELFSKDMTPELRRVGESIQAYADIADDVFSSKEIYDRIYTNFDKNIPKIHNLEDLKTQLDAAAKVTELSPQVVSDYADLVALERNISRSVTLQNDIASSLNTLDTAIDGLINQTAVAGNLSIVKEMIDLKTLFDNDLASSSVSLFSKQMGDSFKYVQLNTVATHINQAYKVVKDHSALFKSLGDVDDGIGLQLYNLGKLKAPVDGVTDRVIYGAKGISESIRSHNAYLSYAHTAQSLVSDMGHPEEVYRGLMDVLERYRTKTTQEFVDLLDSGEIIEYLSDNFRALGVGDSYTGEMFESIVKDYSRQMFQISPNQTMIRLVDGEFVDYYESFLSSSVPGFFRGLTEFNNSTALRSEFEAMMETSRINLMGIEGVNLESARYLVKNQTLGNSGYIENMVNNTWGMKNAVQNTDIERQLNEVVSAGDFNKYTSWIEDAQNKLQTRVSREMDKLNASSLLQTNQMVDIPNYENYMSALRRAYDLEFEAFTGKVNTGAVVDNLNQISKMQTTNLRTYQVVGDMLEYSKKAGRNIYWEKAGFNKVATNTANIISNGMSAEDVASLLKFNSVRNTVFIQESLLPAGFNPDLINDLSKYGISVKNADGMIVIQKNLDTDLFKNLKQSKRRFIVDGANDTETLQLSAMNQAMDHALESTQGTKLFPFDASTYVPARFDAQQVGAFFEAHPNLANYVDVDSFISDSAFLSSRGFTLSFIGDHGTLNPLTSVIADGKANALAHSPVKNIFNSAMSVTEQTRDQIKWLNIMFDESYRVSNLFEDLPDAQIIEAAKSTPAMKFAYLDADLKVHKINIRTQAGLDFAREMNAIVTDTGNFSAMYRNINQYSLKNLPGGAVLDAWRSNVQSPYSAMYLSSPGTVMRNFIDATSKNIIMTGNMNVLSDQWRAYNILRDVQRYANDLGGDLSYARINKYFSSEGIEGITRRFKSAAEAKVARAKFDLVQEYLSSGAAGGGELDAVMNRIQQKNAERILDGAQVAASGSKIEKIAWENPLSKFFMDRFSDVEDMARLGAFMNLKAQGLPDTDIIHRVMAAHFDYATKTPAEIYAQVFVPFITFPLRNFMWWGEFATKNPTVLRSMVVPSQESWLEDDYNKQQIANGNEFAIGNLMSGNILTRNGDYSTLSKFNPSVFDAFSFVPNLVSNPTERIAAPIKNIVKIADGGPISEMEYPAQNNIKRAANLLQETIPRLQNGELDFSPALIPSLFNVYKYEPKEYPDSGRREYYVPRYYSNPKSWQKPGGSSYPTYGGGGSPRVPRPSYAGKVYFAKGGGGTLSTGYVTKNGRFVPGYGFSHGVGNAQFNKDEHIEFNLGKYGPWWRNAPRGMWLRNPLKFNKQRSMYNRLYSKSGNSRLINRVRPIEDPRGLSFRLQDMRYNVF